MYMGHLCTYTKYRSTFHALEVCILRNSLLFWVFYTFAGDNYNDVEELGHEGVEIFIFLNVLTFADRDFI